MPRFSVNDRAQLYYELGKLVRAGISLPEAAETVLDNHLPAGQKSFLLQLKRGLDNKMSISEAIADIRSLDISKLETSIIEATEETGQLGDGFDQLAEYFEMRRNTAREVRGQLIYPAILLHLAIAILIIPAGMQRGFDTAIMEAVITLLVIYAILGGIFFFFRNWSKRAETSASADASLNRIPLIGNLRRKLSLSRFCFVLRAFILAGKRHSDAFAVAAETSQSGELAHHVHRKVVPAIEEGGRAGPILSSRIFTPAFVRAYKTAEEAGSIDVDLGTWAAVFRQESSDAFQRFGQWVPKILYFAVLGFVAYKIVSFYTGYLNGLQDMIDEL
ncbi:MAG: type II secretion system F family protein [Verrucomicrobiota bacterium]